MIRTLHATADTNLVRDLFARAADYVMLESGQAPDTTETHDFFTNAPPGIDPATTLRLGLFKNGLLIAIAEVAFGYPRADDAYVGLLLMDPTYRGRRLGQQMLEHVFTAAKDRQATRILIAVLEENAKAHRFWSRMGFVEEMRKQPKQIGLKTHVQIRLVRPL